MNDEPRSGRRRKVSKRTEARVIRSLKTHAFSTTKQVKYEVNLSRNEKEQISDITIRRLALGHGLHCRRPAAKINLTPIQMARRLEFAQTYKDKDMRYWNHVIFSDESKVELYPQDRRQKLWRPCHKRFDGRFMNRRPKVKSPSLMFWGCINYHGQGDLVAIDGTLTGANYARILRINVIHTITKLNIRSPVFQEDNAPPHTSKLAGQTKEDLSLKTLNWPSYSPDINPIEGIWSYWKERIRRRSPQSLTHLKKVSFDEWKLIPPSIIKSFICNMPKRLEAVISSDGGHTKY